MTKSELINKLALCDAIGTKKAAGEVLDYLSATIVAELSAGNQVVLGQNLGTFKPVTRSGKVPGTGKPYTSTSTKFSVSAALKRELNK
jgi:nucleoid DNA-binding protein